jgi:hypothetical protein
MTGLAMKGPVPGRDLYDDPAFFARYQQMRAAGVGLNETLEQPALQRMLPPVRGADVVELGCGDGALARRLAGAGARSVLAVDSAGRMLDRVARWLRPGGHLVFSVEHPVCTARDPMTGWQPLGDGTIWPVDHYDQETTRLQAWLGTQLVKHHRRLSTLVGSVLAAGLTLTGLDEPQPNARILAERPDLRQHCRRPPLLLISARKPTGASGVTGR